MPSYQAATCSTISRISGDVQLWRRISRLIFRERAMTAASSQSRLPGFKQDAVGHADHADVVQQRGHFDGVALRFAQAQLPRPGRTGQRHAQRMAGGGRVLALQRGEQAAGDPQPHLHQLVVDAPR